MGITGMRVGELRKLSVADITPDGSVIRIHSKGAQDRVVYINDASLRGKSHQVLRFRQRSGSGAGALFLNSYGDQMKPQSVRSKLRRLAKEAGLDRRVTPHMLRHTAAALSIETGVDIRFMQRLLGHPSIAATEIYTSRVRRSVAGYA